MGDLSDAEVARLRAVVADATFASRFALVREIGSGGMGRVFAARERAGDRAVAIKLLDAQLHGDRARFAAEAELLETLEHPAIVAYIAHGITNEGTPYLAMEWLDGEPLSRVLERGPLALTAALDIASRVADALVYLHERGIVHRDIKPSNVVLVGGEPQQAKVIDLGIAKDLAATTGLTSTGQMIGTPGYMAPEQMMGTAIDARVDLFSLGCLLYETVTGAAPFHGTAVVEVLARVLLETPPPASSLRPDVPARLESLIEILMAKSAGDRAPSAMAVAEELHAIRVALDGGDVRVLASACPLAPVSDEPETMREPRALKRAVKRTWRWWLAGAAAGTLALAVAGVMVLRRGDGEPFRVELATTPRTLELGPIVEGAAVGTLGLHQLAGEPARAIWCAPRQAAIIAYRSGDVLALDRQQRLSRLGHVAPAGGAGAALACAPDGRIVGEIGDAGFTISGDQLASAAGAPAKAVDVVVVAGTMHWLAGGVIWAWNGDGAAREIRRTRCTAGRLAPDGNRVACTTASRAYVDDGARVIEGEVGSVSRWSERGDSVYIETRSLGWKRWDPTSGTTRVLGSGRLAFDLGDKDVLVQLQAIATRDGDTRAELPPLPPGTTILTTIPEHGELVVAGASEVKIVPLDRIELPARRHMSPPRTIALAPDGTRIASLATDKLLIHTLDGTVDEIVNELPTSFPRLVWRSDGSLVVVDIRAVRRIRGDGPWTPIERRGVAVDDVAGVVAADGATLRLVDETGALGDAVGEVPMLHDNDRFAVRGSRVLILPADGEPVRIYDMASRRIVREVGYRTKILDGALLADGTAVLVANGSIVHVLDGARAVNLGIRANRSPVPAPVGARFAVVDHTGRVLVYDAKRDAIVLHGTLHAPAVAIAWSRDGKRLAAIGTNGEIRLWTVLP